MAWHDNADDDAGDDFGDDAGDNVDKASSPHF